MGIDCRGFGGRWLVLVSATIVVAGCSSTAPPCDGARCDAGRDAGRGETIEAPDDVPADASGVAGRDGDAAGATGADAAAGADGGAAGAAGGADAADAPHDSPHADADASHDAGSDKPYPAGCGMGAAGAGGAAPPCAGSKGDFDGDGIGDCVTFVAGSTGRLSAAFHKGLTPPAYATTAVMSSDVVPSSALPVHAAAADLDHDGRTDLTLYGPDPLNSPNPNQNQMDDLYILLANADGTFTRQSTSMADLLVGPVGLLAGEPFAADLDGDGRTDLLYQSQGPQSTDNALVFVGLGATGLHEQVTSPAMAGLRGYVPPIVALDVNADGKIDTISQIFYAVSGGHALAVALGTGTGTFTVTAIPYTDGSYQATTADLDGDGKVDLSVIFGTVSVPFYGDGAGHFAPPPPVTATTACTSSDRLAPLADYDGDGLLDCVSLVAGSTTQLTNVFFRQGVAGNRFRVEAVVTHDVPLSTLWRPYANAADLNGDHRADLVVAFHDATTMRDVISVLRGNADGTFSAPTNPPPTSSSTSFAPEGALVADFDGDSLKDVLLAGVGMPAGGSAQACVALVSLGATAADPTVREDCTLPLVDTTDFRPAAIGDVNGDGKPDGIFITTNRDAAMPLAAPRPRLAVAFGDGHGAFSLAPGSARLGIAGTENVYDATPIDCNSDGNLDLATHPAAYAGPVAPTNVFFGDGKGGFSAAPP